MKDKWYLGIDIGGTAVKIGLMNEEGEILKTCTEAVNFDGYETPILETVKKSITFFLKENTEYEKKLCGVGVSATGQIDTSSGIVIGTAGHIKNWMGSKIKEELEELLKLPVSVANDANCAALGEYWIGAAKGVQNVIVITIGTGVGGGIITGGKLLLGAQGIAGELGHFIIQADGKSCSCKSRGCYEKYASTTALIELINDEISMCRLEAFADRVNGKTIFQELKKGNKQLAQLVDHWIDYVAAGMVSLIHIFNPSLMLISGGVSSQKELFIDKLESKIRKQIMPSYGVGLRIEKAALENSAGLAGAVYNHIFSQN